MHSKRPRTEIHEIDLSHLPTEDPLFMCEDIYFTAPCELQDFISSNYKFLRTDYSGVDKLVGGRFVIRLDLHSKGVDKSIIKDLLRKTIVNAYNFNVSLNLRFALTVQTNDSCPEFKYLGPGMNGYLFESSQTFTNFDQLNNLLRFIDAGGVNEHVNRTVECLNLKFVSIAAIIFNAYLINT